MDIAQISDLLGAEARSLLDHQSRTMPKDQLHLPGPDFIDRVLVQSDRKPMVLANLQRMMNTGRLAGTGYTSILPVDQGIEHSAGASFAPNPAMFDPERIVELAVEGGCNAVASTFGVLGMMSRRYAHKIPFLVKINHNEILSYPNTYDQVLFGSVQQAFDLGAVIRPPFFHREGMGHDASPRLHVEDGRPETQVQGRQQVHRHDRRVREVRGEDIALDELRARRNALLGGIAVRQRDHRRVVFDAGRRGDLEVAHCSDGDATVARAQVYQLVAGPCIGHAQHPVDQPVRRRHPDDVLAGLAHAGLEGLLRGGLGSRHKGQHGGQQRGDHGATAGNERSRIHVRPLYGFHGKLA